MLKECLADFWVRRGVADLDASEPQAPGEKRATERLEAPSGPADAERQQKALDLLRQAAAILSGGAA
jgi:hypothetical protein